MKFLHKIYTIQQQMTPQSGSRGFTLLLAALVASITLAIGASIFSIAQKELILSSVGRDSQYAFYAADTAAECALYWDIRFNYFATSAPAGIDLQTVKCDSQCLNGSSVCEDVPGRSSTYPYTMNFQFQPQGYCANVEIRKSQAAVTNAIVTTVRADGFSTSCAATETSPRTLQRSVELHY
jgi:hypothetical protein